jgi:Uma2 family endonuclease
MRSHHLSFSHIIFQEGRAMSAKTLLTLEQFEHLPDTEGAFELDEGELIPMTMARLRHSRIRDRVARRLTEHAEPRGAGEVCIELDFQLSPDTVRRPDVALLSAEQVAHLDPDEVVVGAPILAIEIVSPNDSAQELSRKVELFLAAGTKRVWVFYPKTREVHCFSPGGNCRILRGDEVLKDDELLPGFSIKG